MAQIKDTAAERAKRLDLLQTLPELLTHHIPEHENDEAFREYSAKEQRWVSLTFGEMNARVQQWREAFAALGLSRGDRCAMLMPNCVDAICFDQGVLSDAFVPVPLHAIDTAGSSAYILKDSGSRVLVTNKYLKWKSIRAAGIALPDLNFVVITDDEVPEDASDEKVTVMTLGDFLERGKGTPLPPPPKPSDLAAIVYTSGTTGKPKGVMLTHMNILSNARAVLKHLCPEPEDRWFSFLPLSHTFERTTTYYVGMGMGNTIVFFRTIATLVQDMKLASPTVMMAVPRVYERIYAKIMQEISKKPKFVQGIFNWAVEVGWRRFCKENHMPVPSGAWSFLDPLVGGFLDAKVGGQIRAAFGKSKIHVFVSGGAALNPSVAKCLLGLGIPIVQGYGMTEHSPIIAVHKLGDIHPTTVGPALPNVETKLGDMDELLVRGPSVMKGYWNLPEATAQVLDADGWLHTGDVAEIYEDGHVKIKGRIKEIIVTSTGEKIPPADLEQAIEVDPIVDQVMVIGENRPCIAALIVVNPDAWKELCAKLSLDPKDPASFSVRAARQAVVRRVKAATRSFPNYGIPRDVYLTDKPWTIENGMMTPTLKLKRRVITQHLEKEIDALYDSRGE